MRFVQFMSTPAGRSARIVAGVLLVVAGLFTGGTAGWVIGIVGLVPLAAGATDTCLLAPLFHSPLHGHGGTA